MKNLLLLGIFSALLLSCSDKKPNAPAPIKPSPPIEHKNDVAPIVDSNEMEFCEFHSEVRNERWVVSYYIVHNGNHPNGFVIIDKIGIGGKFFMQVTKANEPLTYIETINSFLMVEVTDEASIGQIHILQQAKGLVEVFRTAEACVVASLSLHKSKVTDEDVYVQGTEMKKRLYASPSTSFLK